MTTTQTKDAVWREMRHAAKRFAEPDDTSDDAAMERYLATGAGRDAVARYEAAGEHAAAHRQLSEPDSRGTLAQATFEHVHITPKAEKLLAKGAAATMAEAVEEVYRREPLLFVEYERAAERDRQRRACQAAGGASKPTTARPNLLTPILSLPLVASRRGVTLGGSSRPAAFATPMLATRSAPRQRVGSSRPAGIATLCSQPAPRRGSASVQPEPHAWRSFFGTLPMGNAGARSMPPITAAPPR